MFSNIDMILLFDQDYITFIAVHRPAILKINFHTTAPPLSTISNEGIKMLMLPDREIHYILR